MTKLSKSLVTIVMADDDPDDRLIFEDAVEEARLENKVSFVQDGQELLDFLNRDGAYSELAGSPMPDLILLDLNMPRMDGRTALEQIKSNEKFRHIPVVILTTSKAEEDIVKSYDLGANSYIQKPVTFDKFVELVTGITNYWFSLVKLPGEQ